MTQEHTPPEQSNSAEQQSEKEKSLRVTPTYEDLVRLWVDSSEDPNYLETVVADSLRQFADERATSASEEEKNFCDEAIAAAKLFEEEYIKNIPAPTPDYMKRVCRDIYINSREAALGDLKDLNAEDLAAAKISATKAFPDSYELQKPENISWKNYFWARAERDALIIFSSRKRAAGKSMDSDRAIEPSSARREHVFTGGRLESDGSVSPENIAIDDILYITLDIQNNQNGQWLRARDGRDGDGETLSFVPSYAFIPNIKEAHFKQNSITLLARTKKITNTHDSRRVVVEPAFNFHEIGDVVSPVAYYRYDDKARYVLPDGRLVEVTPEIKCVIDTKTGFDIITGRVKAKSKKQFPFFRLVASVNNFNPVEYELVSGAELKEEDDLRAVFYSYLGALGEAYPVQEKSDNYSVGPSVDIATRRMSPEGKADLRAALVEATKRRPLIVAIESRRSDIIRGVRALAKMNSLSLTPAVTAKIKNKINDITIEELDVIAGQISALSEEQRQEFFPLDLDSELFVMLLRGAGISVAITPLVPGISVNERLLKMAAATRGRLVAGDLTHGSGTRFIPCEYKDHRTGDKREGMLLQVDEGLTSRSAAQELFNLLQRLGFYSNGRESAMLHTLVTVGASIDSYRGPAYDSYEARKKTYQNYDKNFYGNALYLAKSGQVSQVIEFFRNNVSGRYREIKKDNPSIGLRDAEKIILAELQTLDITRFFNFDEEYKNEHKQKIIESDNGIRELENRGFVLETKYGKILVDPVGAVPLRQMAAFGHGYDGYVSYNSRVRLASINIAGFVKDKKGKPILLPPDLLLDEKKQSLGVLTKEGRYWVMNSDQKVRQGGLAGGLQDVIVALADGSDTSVISAAVEKLLNEKKTQHPISSDSLYKARREVNGSAKREARARESLALLRKIEAAIVDMRKSPNYPAAVKTERQKITEQISAVRACYSKQEDWPEDVRQSYDFVEKQIRDDIDVVIDDLEKYLRSAARPRAPFRSAELFKTAAHSAEENKKQFILNKFAEMLARSGVAAYFGQPLSVKNNFVFFPERFSNLLNLLYERIYRNARP